MAHIQTIQHQEAEARLKIIYDEILLKRGQLAEVHKIQSLNPETIVQHMELYMGIMFSHSPLSRAEREMLAVVVSAANNCAYCQHHHGSALNQYWKDGQKVKSLRNDYKILELTVRERALCDYAHNLTLNPQEYEGQHKLTELKEAGFEDRAILDATLVISYFNFVNRMVLSLGVTLEEDKGEGYKY
ncbi:MAG: peroxidase-related enzyme [Bacteroidetes bacterium]|nr:peroxidase-related enzyme [Bacteroidota bacterium]